MSEPEINEALQFDAAAAANPEDALIIELDGFEGPLDLLLSLARDQKVDLAKISVLKLADQYLAFMEKARARRLELAADYLVMAAWLIYLKSRLVFPQPEAEEGPTADALAAALRWRLQRLQSMREASARLMARDRLGRDVFARGAPEGTNIIRHRTQLDTLYDFLTAYSQHRIQRAASRIYEIARTPFFLIEEARDRLERVLGAHAGMERAVAIPAARMELWPAPPQRPCEHLLRLSRNGAGRQSADSPAQAVWGNFPERPRDP